MFISKNLHKASQELKEHTAFDPSSGFDSRSVLRKIIKVSDHKTPLSDLSLKKKEIEYYQSLEDKLGDDLINIYIFPNHHYVGPNQPPQGSIIVIEPEAQLLPELVSDRLGSIVAMSVVLNEEYLPVTEDQTVEEYFRSKLRELNESIPQVHKSGISLFNSATKQSNIDPTNPKSLQDLYEWKAALGHSRGNFVNVLATETSDKHTESKHYLAVKSDPGDAGKQLKHWMEAAENREITLKEFVSNPLVAKTKSLSERNAQRILAQTADLLKAKIATMDDVLAFRANEHYELPAKAIPQIKNVTDDVVLHTLEDGKQVALVLTQVSWTPAIKGGLIFGSEPTQGLIVYHTPETPTNSMMNGFHNFTGRNPEYSREDSDEISDRKIRNRFRKVITWEASANETELNERMKGMYRKFSPKQESALVQYLGAQYGKTELKLVMGKICSSTPIVQS